jgi:predicted  nucleic acid-binding Zn-ribbon protein
MKLSASVLALTLSVLAATTQAQDANAQKALQKAQYMLRQVSSEKVELQTQVDALKQQNDKLTTELATMKSATGQAQRATEAKYGGAIEQWKQRDVQTSDQLTATKQQLKQQIEQRTQLEAQLQKQTSNFSVCYENNKKLYDLNTQLLGHYENKGLGDVLKQKDPFTGIKQVEIENLVQDYRYQLDDLQVQPIESATGTADGAQQTKNN